MFGKRFALSLIAATAVVSSAPASDDAPRWKASGPFYAVVTRTTERTTSGPTEDKEEKLKTTLVYEVTQKERKGGGWEMVHTLKRADGDGADAETWKPTVGIPFTLEFDAKMNFLKVGGIDKIVAKHAEAEDMSDADKERFSELLIDGILNDLGEAYFPLPAAKPVTVKRKATVAGLLTSEVDRTFTAGKAEKGGVAFPFEGSDRLKPADDTSGDLPFKVVKLDEKKPAKTTGTTWMDTALGRPSRVTKEWSFEITMTVSAAGQEADVSMTEKTAVDVKYLTKMPPDDK